MIPHSHLLARRGLAERIGDLLGQLQFSDDQLWKTQKGLTDAGIPMPNFGNVGRELAKEINEDLDPEPEPLESEEERAFWFSLLFLINGLNFFHRTRLLTVGE